MRLALLGLDETTLALARAAQRSGHDQLVLLCDVEGTQQAQSLLGGDALRTQSWEVLLTGATGGVAAFDAVMVSRDFADDERRLEQLRKLVQGGVPMLVAHPVHTSMLAYYELDMIRRETDGVIVPFLPARRHPLAVRLKEIVNLTDASSVGRVDQVVFERALTERSKAAVLSQFARDVDLLRFLGGEVAQLGAMGSPGLTAVGEFAAYNNLGVQMTGAENRLFRWWVVPADEFSDSRLTVTGERGKATLTMPLEPSAWRLELRTGGEPTVVEALPWNPYLTSLDELRGVLADRQILSRWPDAARAVELTETIDRSLAKGRTIDLYEQEYSPSATFKGIMSSVGCALLLLALAGMIIGALAANLLKHAGFVQAAQVVGAVPYVLLGLLVVFLALQFLLRVARPK
ncbi:MAG: hypothetical protein WD894_12980 [Pirellulales bacterium]